MIKCLYSVYGFVSYLLFLLSFVYAIGFVGDFHVPKTINSGATFSASSSLFINLLLLGAFAIQHSVMARPGFKQWLTQIVPGPLERSTYVLLSSLLLLLLYWQWRPMTTVIWNIESTIGIGLIHLFFWLGWLIVLLSTFMINHFDLFGLRQVYLHYRDVEYSDLDFKVVGLYKLVRHPIMLGFIIAFWSTPVMTVGHLLFAVMTTAYIFIALQFEERDLLKHFGEVYRDYQKKVSMVIPLKW